MLPAPSTLPGIHAALAAGYLPCLEAVLRRHLVPYMADYECNSYCSLPTKGPQNLVSALSQGPLLQLLLSHGELRHAVAMSVSVAKMLLVMADAAARKIKEGQVGSSSGISSGGGGSGISGGGGGGGNSPFASWPELHGARGVAVNAMLGVICSAQCMLTAFVSSLLSSNRQAPGCSGPTYPTALAVLSAAEAAASATTTSCGGAASVSAGPAGGAPSAGAVSTPEPAVSEGNLGDQQQEELGQQQEEQQQEQQQEEEQLLRLTAFALPRWMQLSIHVIDVCERLHMGIPEAAKDIHFTVTLAAAVVLDACDAAQQAGDGRALGSWRQLLYDIASYGWVRDALDELRAPGRQAAGCWHRRGWEPAGPTHGTPPGDAAVEDAGDAEGEGGGGGGGAERGEQYYGSGGGAELADCEAPGGREGVFACVLPPPCEACVARAAHLLLPAVHQPGGGQRGGGGAAGMGSGAGGRGGCWGRGRGRGGKGDRGRRQRPRRRRRGWWRH